MMERDNTDSINNQYAMQGLPQAPDSLMPAHAQTAGVAAV
jgi:hypothetical protein